MYFHTDDPEDVAFLRAMLNVAHYKEARVRVNVTPNGRLTIKVGEGMWSPPMRSTEDPYRD
jgi:hypothetical protein